MSNSSRVPLLVGNKGRKPSRLPIAPRARPSNVDRAKRPASSEDPSSEPAPATDSAPPPSTVVAPPSPERKALPLVLPIAVTTPQSSSPSSSTAAASAPRPAGGISPGHSISVSRLGTFRAASSVPVGSARASPQLAPTGTPGRVGVSPVERLAKTTSKTVVPLYRPQEPRTHASPILGPRATPIPVPHGPPSEHREPNPMLKRLTRKLDIKPHQSPRRAALNQHSGSTPLGASPLILPVPALDVPPELLDELKSEPAQKKRGTKRRSPSSTPHATKKASSKKPVTPRRSIRRKVKKDDSYMDPGDSQDEGMQVGDSDESDDYDDDDNEAEEDVVAETTPRGRSRRRRIKLPDVDNPPVYMPARERATLWAKKVLEASENGEPMEDAAKKESRKRSNSTSSVTSLSTTATSNSRKSKAEERLKKEPSQMTMGELALSIPKGRRMLRHEQEENADSTNHGTHGNRIRSLSMSSETPSFGAGSIVTPQVEIIDGKMVILEATVKLNEPSNGSEYGDDSSRRVRGSRQAAAAAPGKRWGKEETKQFYYCLSQVGPNFSMMATLFPSRKRKELKSKFKYEEKHHPDLIEIALKASAAPLDSEIVDVIGQMADKEIKKQEEKKRRKHSTDSLDDGLHSPATVSSSAVVPSPSPDETMDFDDEDLGELYRERKGSFDFAS